MFGAFHFKPFINLKPPTNRFTTQIPPKLPSNTPPRPPSPPPLRSTNNDDDDDANHNNPPISSFLSHQDTKFFLALLAAQTTSQLSRLLSHPFHALDSFHVNSTISSIASSLGLPTTTNNNSDTNSTSITLQDFLNSLALSECVYKAVDIPLHDAAAALSFIKQTFPLGLVTVSTVQWSLPHVRHRYLIAEGPEALYVACMGTKVPKDMITNISFWLSEVALDAAMIQEEEKKGDNSNGAEEEEKGKSFLIHQTKREDIKHQGNTTLIHHLRDRNNNNNNKPAAHGGFLDRARAIPVDALYTEARKRGKRLVFTGHSLGGSVAKLCTLHLLDRLPEEDHKYVSCFGFATPAIGNKALQELSRQRKWEERMYNYLIPEDPIPRLLSGGSRNVGEGRKGQQQDGQHMNNIVITNSSDGKRWGWGKGKKTEAQEQPLDDNNKDSVVAIASVILAAAEEEESQQPSSSLRQKALSTLKQKSSDASKVLADATKSVGPTLSRVNPVRPPKYYQLGRQRYLLPTRVTDTNNHHQYRETTSTTTTSTTSTTTTAAAGTTMMEDVGDDDSIDVAAAAALASGTLPLPPKRSLFPMHRMLSYRKRVVDICNKVIWQQSTQQHDQDTTKSTSVQKPPSFPSLLPFLSSNQQSYMSQLVTKLIYHTTAISSSSSSVLYSPMDIYYKLPITYPTDVILSEDQLGPKMYPIAAQGKIIGLDSNVDVRGGRMLQQLQGRWTAMVNNNNNSNNNNDDGGGSNNNNPSLPKYVDIQVVIRGKGLSNATSAWVEVSQQQGVGGMMKKEKKRKMYPVKIVSKPAAPSLVGAWPTSPSLSGGVRGGVSWFASKVGLVGVVEKLQPPDEDDVLCGVCRVGVPMSVLPGMKCCLESDFVSVELPLELDL
jgi:hypothetical protein